ncbi:MAG: hypothetical protein ABI629_22620 [bacterium]
MAARLRRAAHIRRVVCELRHSAIVQADPNRHTPAGPGARAILSLDAGQQAPGLRLPLELQSMSPSGLAVFTAASTPPQVDPNAIGNAQEGEALTFVLEQDGRSTTLQASLVWLEVSGEPTHGQRFELIVDTGDQPGWREVQSALAGK